MKNIYEIEVKARCPNRPRDVDVYQFTIESDAMIQVEAIAAFFADNAGIGREVFQEALTLECANYLGAAVTSIGYHQGIKVTSIAP